MYTIITYINYLKINIIYKNISFDPGRGGRKLVIVASSQNSAVGGTLRIIGYISVDLN